MFRILFFVFYMIAFTGCATSDGLEKFKEAMLGKTDDNSTLLNTPSSPEKTIYTVLSPPEEALVREAAQSKKTVSAKMGDASFEFEENGFTVVSYNTKKDTGVTNIKCILHNNAVVALSEQSKLPSIDPYAFTYAKEIAQQKLNGTISDIPVMYKWHAFQPELFDKCTVLVREKDQDVEYFVYRIDVCKK